MSPCATCIHTYIAVHESPSASKPCRSRQEEIADLDEERQIRAICLVCLDFRYPRPVACAMRECANDLGALRKFWGSEISYTLPDRADNGQPCLLEYYRPRIISIPRTLHSLCSRIIFCPLAPFIISLRTVIQRLRSIVYKTRETEAGTACLVTRPLGETIFRSGDFCERGLEYYARRLYCRVTF